MTITRSDLESKLAEVEAALGSEAQQARSRALPVGVVAGLLLLLIVYALGRRRGKKQTTVVEIRRV